MVGSPKIITPEIKWTPEGKELFKKGQLEIVNGFLQANIVIETEGSYIHVYGEKDRVRLFEMARYAEQGDKITILGFEVRTEVLVHGKRGVSMLPTRSRRLRVGL